MGKKKGAAAGPSQEHLQIYQRMNYLYQAATLMSTIGHQQTQTKSDVSTVPLGRYYNNTMKKIGKRLLLRADPTIKRTICKRCDTTLIPTLTATVRAHERASMIQCKTCGTQKKLATGKQMLFSQQEEHILKKEQTEQ
ncbi:RNAse P Rpr2/Rpp21/SNM1 subunit domain-containing protein [Dichotomocladium elegans]|nr:RNAse P Rpr2/Rpp21/SNM1 subunit domain-containing protein [Dichotomocladium elegans]